MAMHGRKAIKGRGKLTDELHDLPLPCMQLAAAEPPRVVRRGMPVRYPRTTNSTGKTRQRRMMDTLGSGTASSALGAMCCVSCIHHALVWLSTCPCGMAHALKFVLGQAAEAFSLLWPAGSPPQ